MGTVRRALEGALATGLSAVVLLSDIRPAEACGCLSPPAVSVGEFAVNQRAEQIIFEVEPGWVTAHVMIAYAGAPESFAWIVPVPEAPELGITPPTAFAVLDRATAPNVFVNRIDACPVSEWICRYHPQPSCGGDLVFDDDSRGSPNGDGDSFADAGAGAPDEPPVTVIDQQVVGDYQTVTFRADEAAAATQWLRDNGFVVNPTTSIYMEPYINQGMVFVAAKLVAGAGVSAIKPLRLKYRADYPMVPLVLTAVAAEPHLTVTSYVFGDSRFQPQGHPVTTVQAGAIASNASGRTNYPMVLARVIDDAGGDAFVVEYAGSSRVPLPNEQTGCCLSDFDACGIGNNDQCECPTAEFDQADCSADLREGFELVQQLGEKHTWATRLTTRVSAEEMTFDPKFEPTTPTYTGTTQLIGDQLSLQSCAADVVDTAEYKKILAQQECATVYCGEHGTCVGTAVGPACKCDDGYVAQRFVDLDNLPSVTCVPETPPVDLRAGGEALPDGCAGQTCGVGACIDRNGVPVCDCVAGAAAVVGADDAKAPRCVGITQNGTTPGARDYSDALDDLDVCAPPPPQCGPEAWYERRPVARKGVACPGRVIDPPPILRVPGPAPTCGDGLFGCGCQAPNGDPVALLGGAGVVALLVLRRRRRGARA